AMMGMLVRGLGADHVVWGTDAIWTGSPQWQIEALRRLEIPEDMQKQHGFKPLGAADGPIKSAIFGETNARLYKYERRAALATDRFAALRAEYEAAGGERSNLRYGYVAPARG
ncbi:MAG: amidohydrolase, partial [Candidatus Rokuibacteriota bacterium]